MTSHCHRIVRTKSVHLAPPVPTYIYSSNDTTSTDAAIVDMEWLERMYRRMYKNDHFCIIADGSAISDIGPTHLNRLVALLRELRPKTEAQVIASAIIITNSNIRMIVNGLMFIYPPVSPVRIVDTMAEAHAFILEHVSRWRHKDIA